MGQLALAKPMHSCNNPPPTCSAHLGPLHKLQHSYASKPPLHTAFTPANLSLNRIVRACAHDANAPSSPSSTATPLTSKTPPPPSPTEPSSDALSPASYYTSMKDGPLGYWRSYQGLEKVGDYSKGWINQNGEEDPLMVAHLHLIANMAADRAEMHSMIAQQRDNWNRLFQSSLTAITMAATVLASINGHANSISFSLPACIMDAIVAGMMVGINKFQPSQLAEEQRTASRLCKKLHNDIEFTLKIAPHLRQEAQAYVEETVSKLLAVDKAYPLPLTPVVVEKFPKEILAPLLSKHSEEAKPEIHASGNGWEADMSENLVKVGNLMHESDTKAYIIMAERVKKINIACAVAGPVFAMMGAALNAFDALNAMGAFNAAELMNRGEFNVGVYAAVASTMAAFAGSFAHDAQLGMIFELYKEGHSPASGQEREWGALQPQGGL